MPPDPPDPAIRRPVGGTASSVPARRSTPTATSSCARTCSAAARGRPDRPRPGPTGLPYGSRFPVITIRDQVAVEVALADTLGIAALGRRRRGLHGRHAGPRVVRRLPRAGAPRRRPGRRGGGHGRSDRAVLVAGPRHSFRPGVRRRRLLRDGCPPGRRARHRAGDRPGAATGPARSSRVRFGRDAQAEEDPLKGGRYAVESYLEHHGDKLAERFDPNSYVVLSEAMNHHDVGRGRGGIARALGHASAPR